MASGWAGGMSRQGWRLIPPALLVLLLNVRISSSEGPRTTTIDVMEFAPALAGAASQTGMASNACLDGCDGVWLPDACGALFFIIKRRTMLHTH